MVELWLVRHGQTEFNAKDLIQGVSNSVLTTTGVEGAKALGRGLKLAGVRFDAAYSSPLIRANETAHYALTEAGQGDLPVEKKDGLHEQDYGKFEGQPSDDLMELLFGLPSYASVRGHGHSMAEIAQLVWEQNQDQHPNVAETFPMVQKRFAKTMDAIVAEAEANGAERVLTVAHGTAIFAWLDLIGFKDQYDVMKNVAVCKLSAENGQYKVIDYNDRSYVDAGVQD